MIMLFSGMIITAKAQLRSVPAEVTNAFKVKFPNATDVKWSDKLTNFEATFNISAVKMWANFKSDGKWIRTETLLTQLPTAVQDGFAKSKFNNWEIKDRRKLERLNEMTLYKVEVQQSTLIKKNLFLMRLECCRLIISLYNVEFSILNIELFLFTVINSTFKT